MQSTRIPVFRRGNAIHLSEEFEVSTRLKNPHIGLKDPDMPDVQVIYGFKSEFQLFFAIKLFKFYFKDCFS